MTTVTRLHNRSDLVVESGDNKLIFPQKMIGNKFPFNALVKGVDNDMYLSRKNLEDIHRHLGGVLGKTVVENKADPFDASDTVLIPLAVQNAAEKVYLEHINSSIENPLKVVFRNALPDMLQVIALHAFTNQLEMTEELMLIRKAASNFQKYGQLNVQQEV